MRRRLLIAAAATASVLTISGGTLAPAAQDACTYKRTQRTVVLDFTRLPQVGGDLAVHQADLHVGPGGSIVSSESFPGGAQDHPCGAATTANTRLIQVVGAGERDTFVLDERSGRLADLMRVNLGGGAPGASLDTITMYLHGGTSTFGSTATDIDGVASPTSPSRATSTGSRSSTRTGRTPSRAGRRCARRRVRLRAARVRRRRRRHPHRRSRAGRDPRRRGGQGHGHRRQRPRAPDRRPEAGHPAGRPERRPAVGRHRARPDRRRPRTGSRAATGTTSSTPPTARPTRSAAAPAPTRRSSTTTSTPGRASRPCTDQPSFDRPPAQRQRGEPARSAAIGRHGEEPATDPVDDPRAVARPGQRPAAQRRAQDAQTAAARIDRDQLVVPDERDPPPVR